MLCVGKLPYIIDQKLLKTSQKKLSVQSFISWYFFYVILMIQDRKKNLLKS